MNPILTLDNLVTRFRTDDGIVTALDGVSLTIEKGRTLGLVGESGSGKSVTSLSIMGLLPQDVGFVANGKILFEGRDLASLSSEDMMKLRGYKLAMIFQEPMTALNPVLTAGEQVMEVFQVHKGQSPSEARKKTLELFKKVKIPDPERRIDEYPHQMSGGMKQRVMIAMALACEPALVIADEPTTALDVTIQAQILSLLKDLQADLGTSILFITHDLSVIAEMADTVAVMYAGRIVERADVFELFENPQHPYTQGLMGTLQAEKIDKSTPLKTIPGVVPSLNALPKGCRFQDRCVLCEPLCRKESPQLAALNNSEHLVACFVAQRDHKTKGQKAP
jgi:peptide/nickel transport system ATP-binding protein